MKQLESGDCKTPELTRREWLLKLGEAAVLLGFSGSATELAGGVVALPPADTAQLPPGLYEPLSEHLGHALTLDSAYHPVVAGSQTDYVRPPDGPFQPQFFAPDEFRVIRRLVELMLGEARSAKRLDTAMETHDRTEISQAVAEWIDLSMASAPGIRDAAQRLAPEHRRLAVAFHGPDAVQKLETWNPQRIAKEGLDRIEHESRTQYKHAFLELEESQQIAILSQLSRRTTNKTAEDAGTRFFELIKSEVIRGFYTSQAGLKELGYTGNAFYAESPGCVGHQH